MRLGVCTCKYLKVGDCLVYPVQWDTLIKLHEEGERKRERALFHYPKTPKLHAKT